jgi:hypothetical protein
MAPLHEAALKRVMQKDIGAMGARNYKDPCSKWLRRPSSRESVKGHFCSSMLRLAQSAPVIRAFKNFAIEVHGGLEAGSMIRSLSDACIGREIEAAPLSKLLKLVFVHTWAMKHHQITLFSSHSIFHNIATLVPSPRYATYPSRNQTPESFWKRPCNKP